MTTIGLIGSGNIGSGLARLAVAAGYDVIVSNSRAPETLSDLVAELGPRARAAAPAEAAAASDLAIVTIPLKAYPHVPVAELRGKTVIDTNNYYPERDGRIAELDDESMTTSELLQRHAPESRVVKAFNSIYFPHLTALARPSGSAERSTLPIAGDDLSAKQAVTEFLDRIGFDALDAGPLAEGWRFQRDTPAYTRPYFSGEDPDLGRQVSRDELAARLAEARRYRGM